jgi:hypothetical protein
MPSLYPRRDKKIRTANAEQSLAAAGTNSEFPLPDLTVRTRLRQKTNEMPPFLPLQTAQGGLSLMIIAPFVSRKHHRKVEVSIKRI